MRRRTIFEILEISQRQNVSITKNQGLAASARKNRATASFDCNLPLRFDSVFKISREDSQNWLSGVFVAAYVGELFKSFFFVETIISDLVG